MNRLISEKFIIQCLESQEKKAEVYIAVWIQINETLPWVAQCLGLYLIWSTDFSLDPLGVLFLERT